MTRYGLPQDGIIARTLEISEGLDIAEVSGGETGWVEIGPEVRAGWTAVRVAGDWTFAAPAAEPAAPTAPVTTEQLAADLDATMERARVLMEQIEARRQASGGG